MYTVKKIEDFYTIPNIQNILYRILFKVFTVIFDSLDRLNMKRKNRNLCYLEVGELSACAD